MCPIPPKQIPDKKGFTPAVVLIGLLAVASIFNGCQERKLRNGIDTPIVISGGSLKLFSDTPFTEYKKDNDKEITHPKEENKVANVTVENATESYNKPVSRKCDVTAFYTGSVDEDTVKASTKEDGKKLKIHFGRRKFDEYDKPDDKNRIHPDEGNQITRVEVKNGSETKLLTCKAGGCTVRFKYVSPD